MRDLTSRAGRRTIWNYMVPELSGSVPGDDRLTAIFRALADPTRRAILARLATGEASVNELAAPFEIGVRAISKHVGVLERAGLVVRSRDAQRHLSRLDTTALREAYSWIDVYRRLWETRFDRIGRIIEKNKGSYA
jgi:DNA-binding transcriptional ArsR family regulator